MGLFGKSEYEKQLEIANRINSHAERQIDEMRRQGEETSRQQAATARHQAWSEQQLKLADESYVIHQAHQARYERLLETWERQAVRFDAILKKWEEAGPK